MNKEQLPRWGWLIIGLVIAAILAGLINVLILHPLGYPSDWDVVTTIAAMAPVIVFIGFWYDDDRQEYWEQTSLRIYADITFVIVGALLGGAIAMLLLTDLGLPQLVRDIITMGSGFILGWGLFYFRNPSIYRQGEDE